MFVTAEADSALARAVGALLSFPTDEDWVLIGGLAVFIRLGAVTRPTADADTIARSQAALIQQLVDADSTTVVSGGNLEIASGGGRVEVDVMDLADEPLPDDPERRAFARARRTALTAAKAEQVTVIDRNRMVVAEATIPVASTAALVALKTVSMVRRPHSKHPEKVGSDIHDLVRLVAAQGARAIAEDLVVLDSELAAWVAEQVTRAFGGDLRYTLLRLHRYDRSPGAQALSDDDVAATAILGDALRENLRAGPE